jgi:hypothetical protein
MNLLQKVVKPVQDHSCSINEFACCVVLEKK